MKSRQKTQPELVDESTESEILIQPDGRVFAFGITGPVAAVLASLPTPDDRTKRLLERIRGLHLDSRDGEKPQAQESRSCRNR